METTNYMQIVILHDRTWWHVAILIKNSYSASDSVVFLRHCVLYKSTYYTFATSRLRHFGFRCTADTSAIKYLRLFIY